MRQLKKFNLMENKNIIITGTSRGIGFELALQFANAGHQVLAISRNTKKELLEHSHISCLPIDIANENDLLQVADFVKETWQNKVDILIHNAGLLVNKPFENLSFSDFERNSESSISFFAKDSIFICDSYDICVLRRVLLKVDCSRESRILMYWLTAMRALSCLPSFS